MKIQLMERNQKTEAQKVVKRCRFFNTGFCKSRGMCPFLHPDSICDDYLKSGNCDQYRTCLKRHPKECRDWRQSGKCFQSCAYLHKSFEHEQLENDEIEGNMEKLDIDEKADKILVNHDEIVEEMSVEEMSVEEMSVEDII